MGLMLPTKAPISQPFGGHYPGESPGYLMFDPPGQAQRGRKTPSAGFVFYRDAHLGVDQAIPVGTPLLAPERSRLVAAGTYVSTGEHFVMLQIRPGVIIFVTHLKPGGILLRVGQVIGRGGKFALSGNSGRSSGPHVHWEIRKSTATADPANSGTWTRWNGARMVTGHDLAGLDWLRPIL